MVDRSKRELRRKAVLVDTSALYALFDRDDQHNAAAHAAYRHAVGDHRDLVTTNFTLVELHALMTNRISATAATETLFELESGDMFIARVEPEDELIARQILRQYTDKGFSLLDATSFAVMERLGIDTAFSFDRHCAQYRWTVLD